MGYLPQIGRLKMQWKASNEELLGVGFEMQMMDKHIREKNGELNGPKWCPQTDSHGGSCSHSRGKGEGEVYFYMMPKLLS